MINNNTQKGFALPVVPTVIVTLILLFSIGYFAIQKQSQKNVELESREKALIEKEAMEKTESEAMLKNEGKTIGAGEGVKMPEYIGKVLAGKSSPLLEFTKADYDLALKSDKLVVLYFYANWCPLCKVEFPEAQKAFDALDSDKVIGFRVSFNDSDTDNDEKNLARENGVPYQHTKVFIKNGKQILKAPDTWKQDRYISEINKALTK
jgi:thiol-disulfide isomerase/thioredoxin